MKKQVLAIALAFGITGAFAQDLTSKKGEKFLPEAGEWALGFDAIPAINALGSLMGGNGNSATNPTYNGLKTTLYAKMFKDEKTAYRAMLGINFNTATTKTLVNQVTSTSTPPAQVENSTSISSNGIRIGGGYEMRRGTTRLQGYYGGMVSINFGGGSTTNTYGNALSATYQNHLTNGGVKENKSGSTFGLNLGGFIGAEYFIIPKISLGAEYNWGIDFQSTGKGSMTSEAWDTTTNGVKTTTTETAGNSAFSLGNGISSFMVMFHF